MSSLVYVTLSSLSGRRRCWALPASHTFQDLRKLVKARLHIAKQRQSFVVECAVVNWSDTLGSYGPSIHVTLMVSRRTCSLCGHMSELKACGQCLETYYCGTECQGRDWPMHRELCSVSES